jgi:hypothetical protein
MKPNLLCRALAIFCFGSGGLCTTQAARQVFTLDSSQSQITVAGKAAGFTFSEQAPGSLTTHYHGTMNMEVAANAIQFTGGSTMDAQTNGVWQPASGGGTGSAPGDYGGKASITFGTAYTALRNVVVDVTSGILSITNGNFDSSALVFSFPTNAHSVFDYNAGFLGSGTVPLAGYSTNTVLNGASLTNTTAGQKLTIHLDATYIFSLLSSNDSTLHMTGQLIATGAPPAVVIHSIVVTGSNATLTVENASASSQLQGSTNMVQWFPVNATTNTVGGLTTFTTSASGVLQFFRVQM